jgi:hypothetical protein
MKADQAVARDLKRHSHLDETKVKTRNLIYKNPNI